MHTLMAGAPHGLDAAGLETELLAVPHVLGVHDLHAWTLSGDKHNLWAHVTISARSDHTPVLYALQQARPHYKTGPPRQQVTCRPRPRAYFIL